MTASEYRYIQAIEQIRKEKGKVIMTDIAQKLTYARASVHKKLLSLEQQGLISKSDGKLISVTKKGTDEYECLRRFSDVCADMLAERTGLDRKFLVHDAVNMACVLSSRCRNALIKDNNSD